ATSPSAKSGARPKRNQDSRSGKSQNATYSDSKPKHAKPSVKSAKPVVSPWNPNDFNVPVLEDKVRFHDFDLAPELMRGIFELGFRYCSPIQAQSLPYALQGKDVVGKAQTGTGKTAAFLTATIDYMLKSPLTEKRYAGEARALIIAPTRELVIQIAEDAKSLCKYTGLQVHTLVGGMDYAKQQRYLHDNYVDILVATPGRLLD